MKAQKKSIYIILAVLLVFNINSIKAIENLEVNLLEKSKLLRMELRSPAASEINLLLLNENARVLFNDRIDAGSTFLEEFDFSSVRNGTYTLASEFGFLRYNRIIEVRNDNVEFIDSFYSFIPQFKLSDNELLVQYYNTSSEDIGLSIEDQSGVIWDAYYNNPGETFKNRYDLKTLSRGSYKFTMATDGEFFSYDFNVE